MTTDHAKVVLIDDRGTRSDDRLVDGLRQTNCIAQAGDAATSRDNQLVGHHLKEDHAHSSRASNAFQKFRTRKDSRPSSSLSPVASSSSWPRPRTPAFSFVSETPQ